jgi:hypothetical protein
MLDNEDIINKPYEGKENFQIFTCKEEEIKFFLKEYKTLDSQSFDFYYLMPFQWMIEWDKYITDKSSAYPEKIINTFLLTDNHTIKDNLIENLDFVIVPKNLGYFFHDSYGGGRRLKSKNRHLYSQCKNTKSKTKL